VCSRVDRRASTVLSIERVTRFWRPCATSSSVGWFPPSRYQPAAFISSAGHIPGASPRLGNRPAWFEQTKGRHAVGWHDGRSGVPKAPSADRKPTMSTPLAWQRWQAACEEDEAPATPWSRWRRYLPLPASCQGQNATTPLAATQVDKNEPHAPPDLYERDQRYELHKAQDGPTRMALVSRTSPRH
jgi:hypothetical protein